ncbi:unnamed protein product [Urochloa decumbens]|uniref:F-box domain-containing protein n=1 Tax=Urochloa decumbens TaxID=240449 RepID=A0ABC9BRQ4_9POAL
MADEEGLDLPDDALVQVLLRLPTSSRRRFRLVCKHWRNLINERTPEWRARARILTFLCHRGISRAHVFDDGGGAPRHAWTYRSSNDRGFVHLVGSCNGLLCLHDNAASPGFAGGTLSAVSVTNPLTGKTVALPPVPAPWELEHVHVRGALGKYSFGYHPTTGEYKVVHIPWRRGQAVDVVWVFTLGGASWREVPVVGTPGATSCHRSSEAATVDGVAYWLNAPCDRVVALDLGDERVTWLDTPAAAAPRPAPEEAGRWQLTSVHARLGLAVASRTRVIVWVLERRGENEQPRWSLRYRLVGQPQPHPRLWNSAAAAELAGWWVTAPHLTHGGYVVSESWDRSRLYRHKIVAGVADRHDRSERRKPLEVPVLGANHEFYCSPTKVFAYVESHEPLPTMRGHGGRSASSSTSRAAN